MIKKDTNIVPYTEVIGELNGKEIVEICHKKYLQKTNQTEFITEKLITKKVINYMSNRKVVINH